MYEPDICEGFPLHGASVLNHHIAHGVIEQRDSQVKRVHKQVLQCGEGDGGGDGTATQL